uniref:Uncharacterized protein n=1 Tax=Panagrolaimus sp. JU765 TaxID=591449 RepID=A0AC34PZA8_9BILA
MKAIIAKRQQKAKLEEKSEASEDLLNGEFGGNACKIDALEKKQILPKDNERAGDCVFFDASNSKGWWLTLGMAQRQKDIINLFFILKVPGLGTFVNEELPTTSNVEAVKSDVEYRTKSGFCIRCIEPMRKWHISFNGFLVPGQACQPNVQKIGEDSELDSTVKRIPASFDLTWTNYGDYFDFDAECSPESIGRSIALEPWSREMFQKLKSTHQKHYEQFGNLTGIFNIAEYKTPENVKMMSMRDHTITKYRNWSEIRRYIMIIYHLEDGTCIHTSIISMPETVFTHLQFGYVITPDLRKVPVDFINLHLSNIGENKTFPKSFKYSFRAGSLNYNVEVEVKDMVRFKMGLDLKCYVEENMCVFKANGIPGYGFAEVEYRIDPY